MATKPSLDFGKMMDTRSVAVWNVEVLNSNLRKMEYGSFIGLPNIKYGFVIKSKKETTT
jgi:hypothetical protein